MKLFHYHQDPLYDAAAAILAGKTVNEEAVCLEEGVEDIAAVVKGLKKGDKTNFGVVTDVGQNNISFKAKDLPITKIAFNQRKMGSKDFVLDQLIKLKEGVELEEGVGDYSVKKTGSSVSKGEEDYEQDVTTTNYDILKGGKTIGNLSTNDFMGGVYGKMYGKDLPDLEGYGSSTSSGVLGKLHKFLKSNTGMKWMAKNVKEGDELEEAVTPKEISQIKNEFDMELIPQSKWAKTYQTNVRKVKQLYGIPQGNGKYDDVYFVIYDDENKPYGVVDVEGTSMYAKFSDAKAGLKVALNSMDETLQEVYKVGFPLTKKAIKAATDLDPDEFKEFLGGMANYFYNVADADGAGYAADYFPRQGNIHKIAMHFAKAYKDWKTE